MDQQSVVETQSAGDNSYVFEGQTLLFAATVTVFLFVVLLVGLHMYTRWCLRRGGSARRTRVVVISADNQIPDSASDRGLEAAVLSSLPTVVFSSKAAEQEKKRPLLECAHCAVCLSDFVESEIVRLLPKCNHSFHIECIDMWFHSHSTCPLCRSPVEPAPNRIESSQVVVEIADEEASGPEPGPSSGSGLCATCHHEEGNANVNDNCTTSLARRRKAANGAVMGVKIEVVAEFENELRQSSPVTRLLSFKRLLSMGRKSPAGSGASPRHMAGTSRGATELDLENGLGEPIRVYTPE